MAKRPEIPADTQLLEEVSRLLETGEESPSRTRLEYWRHWEYIPSKREGWGRGSTLSYPPGTARQVVALMRELDRQRRLDKAALSLFFDPEGYWVGARALRRAVAAELENVRLGLEKLAHIRRGPRAAAPDPEQTAIRLVERLMSGRGSAEMYEQRTLMLERLHKPALWTDEESAEERFTFAFTVLLYTFLSGKSEPGMNDVFYETFVAYGGEEVVTALLPAGATVGEFHERWGAFAGAASPPESAIVPDDVAAQMLSLPYLAHTLKAMDTVDFERARDDSPLLVDLLVFLVRAAGALLPQDVIERLWSLDDVDWPFAIRVAGLPLLFELRRRNAAALDANLAAARENLPAWQMALELGIAHGVFADALKQKAILAATIEQTRRELQQAD